MGEGIDLASGGDMTASTVMTVGEEGCEVVDTFTRASETYGIGVLPMGVTVKPGGTFTTRGAFSAASFGSMSKTWFVPLSGAAFGYGDHIRHKQGACDYMVLSCDLHSLDMLVLRDDFGTWRLGEVIHDVDPGNYERVEE